ncbi:MAG: hypothetical protein HQK86_05140 [Nitrospinae bacterium]|nr:hypothetical protein [Nitrospinota bacterium]
MMALALAFAPSCSSSVNSNTDVTNFTLEGFKLGMTVEEAAKAVPSAKIEEVKAKDGASLGFKGLSANVSLRFTSRDLGGKLYFIQRLEFFPEKPDTKKLYDDLVKIYGTPDYSGRDIWRVHASWGKPVGNSKHLIFEVRIAGQGMLPMTVTLQDPMLGSENQKLALKHPL